MKPKKLLSFLLATAMTISLLPTFTLTASAATTTEKNITLGTSALSGYDSTNGYKYVYYGTYVGNPIKWRILSMNGNEGTYKDNNNETVDSAKAMFLLSEYALKTMAYDSDGTKNNDSQKYVSSWRYSDVWDWCNTTFKRSSFTESETKYFLKTSKGEPQNNQYIDELEDDTFFFISTAEAEDIYNECKNLRAYMATRPNDNAVWWWLRSPYNIHNVHCVDNDGSILNYFVSLDDPAARPAFNLNTASILFTTPATALSGGKDKSKLGLKKNSDYSGNEYKLTMLDESRKDFSVTSGASVSASKGENITIQYSGAVAGDNEYISAIITSKNDSKVLYYGQLEKAISGDNKTANLKIPDDITLGDYDLYLFNEQVNDDEKTDFSSAFYPVTLNVEKADVTITVNSSECRKTYNGAAIDVSKLFNINPNAGAATYSIVRDMLQTSAGTLNGTNLTVGKVGDFSIIVETAETDTHKAGSQTATLTVDKGTPTARDFSITMPLVAIYDGRTIKILVTSYELGMSGNITVKYFYNGSETPLEPTALPTNAGTYKVKIDVAEGTNYNAANDLTADDWEFTIAKAIPTENKKTTATVRKGKTLAEAIVTEGEFLGVDGATLGGTFAWDNGTKTVSADGAEQMIFTPTDTNYAPITFNVEVSTYSSSLGGGAARYTVSFDTDGGNSVASQSIFSNGMATEPAKPTKEGYVFGGWYTDGKFTTEYDFDTKVTKNITLYAKWTEVETEEPDDDNKDDEPTTDEWKNPFTDVRENDWFFDSVKYANENGLMSGVTNNIFAPNESLTRAMLVTVLYRLESEPAVNRSIPFADVRADSYCANAVIWAAQNGIVSGISETEFAPDENITREQIAAILYRYAQYKGTAPEGAWAIRLEYADAAEISDYAVEGVMYCTLKGIMQGKGDNMFAPKDNATRAEIAAILQRFIEGNK